jgi:hypothetical protein
MIIYAKNYKGAIHEFKNLKRHENEQLLRSVDIVNSWDPIQINSFADGMREITYEPGQFIY